MMLANIFIFICFMYASVVLILTQPLESENKIDARIIDGQLTGKQIFYEVAIISDDEPTQRKICSGALINVRWVLTSAYCATRRPILRVCYGTRYVNMAGSNCNLVYKKYVHPYFNRDALLNDIALLELNPVATGIITVLSLPTIAWTNYEGSFGIVSGWGAKGSYQEPDGYLYSKQVNIINNAYCTEYNMTPYKLCTGGRVICEGDQGAPLSVNGVIVGIASASLKPLVCEGEIATAYTRVNYYLTWIQQITNSNNPCGIICP